MQRIKNLNKLELLGYCHVFDIEYILLVNCSLQVLIKIPKLCLVFFFSTKDNLLWFLHLYIPFFVS